MSMLLEKRKEFADKLNKLLDERTRNIEEKVKAYEAQLKAEPLSEDITKIQSVINALDEVIAYDSVSEVKQEVNVESIKSTSNADTVTPAFITITNPSTLKVEKIETQGREGMETIDFPSRS